MHGFLNIDKPLKLTSHDVVARVRRLVGKGVKVGHAGTLDPAASGVLPVALGHATRLIEYLAEARKGYRAIVTLGITTTTDDAEGEVLSEKPVPTLDRETLEAVCAPFRGAIQQIPPIYSALHHEGQRLYDLARAGKSVELAPRPVTIYRLAVLDYAVQREELLLDIECSKGTYIRALARDLGAALGCGAHLSALRRTFVGGFASEQSIPLDTLLNQPTLVQSALLAPELAIADWPMLTLNDAELRLVRNGMALERPALRASQARAHAENGALVALLRWDETVWRPTKVLG
jgi:tRNA pseudouridine55 synthase